MLPCLVLRARACERAEAFNAVPSANGLVARVRRALTGGAPAVVVLCGVGEPLLRARAQVRSLHQALLPVTIGLSARVSRSATDGLAAWVASTCGPVGVDVQSEVTPIDPALLGMTLHPQEAGWLADASNREMAFTRLWAGKEAVLKALGVGLSWSPREVDARPIATLALPAPALLPAWRDVHVPVLGRVWLTHLAPPASLRVAVAVALNAGHAPVTGPFSWQVPPSPV